ncbi:MAG TPA: choice-of-anchor Q domain-containing protein, partial [Puia sp.]|nr:choice-of-anchor Q domain-containing protein [Puia sp.]
VIGLGGVYQFEYCTVASYSTNLLFHQQPVLTVSNSGIDGSQVITADLNAGFINCIFWGSENIPDEAAIQKQGSNVFNVRFDHTILKQQNYPANIDSSSLWLNANPLFIATGTPGNEFNYQLQPGSPALDRGINSGIFLDLNGDPRPVNLSDLGCYERQ